MSDVTYLYVIGREDGPVKVGISNGPGGRLGTIRTSCPFPVELWHAEPMKSRDHAVAHERSFHFVYAEKRLVGEWFDLDADEAIDWIKTDLSIEEWEWNQDQRMRLP